MSRIRKTEHTGAKNGGGYWGTRYEAKTLSKKLRRELSKVEIKKQLKSDTDATQNTNTFVIVLDKITGVNATKETIARHIEHLRKLDQKGLLIMCGPFTDFPSGLVVINAKTKKQAIKIAESDPFVQEGVRSYSIRSWLLATAENNYLG